MARSERVVDSKAEKAFSSQYRIILKGLIRGTKNFHTIQYDFPHLERLEAT